MIKYASKDIDAKKGESMMKKKLIMIAVVLGLILNLCACEEKNHKTTDSTIDYDTQYSTSSNSVSAGEHHSYQSAKGNIGNQKPADNAENKQPVQSETNTKENVESTLTSNDTEPAAAANNTEKNAASAVTANNGGITFKDKDVKNINDAIQKYVELNDKLQKVLIARTPEEKMKGENADIDQLLAEARNTVYGNTREVLSIKNAYLPQYSDTVTLGDALDLFLSNPSWSYAFKQTNENEGIINVRCTGYFWYQNRKVNVDIRFLIENFRITDDAAFIMGIEFNNGTAANQMHLSAEKFFYFVYDNARAKNIHSNSNIKGATFIDEEGIFSKLSSGYTGGISYTGEASQNNTNTWNGSSENYIASYKLDKERFEMDDLKKMSKSDVRMLINAMYAYHGYTFNSEDIGRFFGRISWYTPQGKSTDDCDAEFNDCEYYNKQLFVAYEEEMGWR